MPWYLYLAFKQLFPSGRRFPFFTAIAALSVALGVALLLVVLSVMGGFGYQIHQMMKDSLGDGQIRADGFIADPAPIMAAVSKVPGVMAVTPFAQGFVMLEHNRKPAFPTIQGIDVDTVGKVIPLDRFIELGSLDDLDDDSVIISSQLADSLGASVGSQVEVYSPLLIEKLKNDEIMLPRELTVAGIYHIGYQQLDSSTVMVTLRLMQELYGLGNAVHGINIRIAPDLDADDEMMRINSVLEAGQGTLWPRTPGLQARSWREIFQGFLWVLQLEKNIMTVILLFVVLVAAFLTMSLLLVLVLKKTREIGLLGALGAGRAQVAACFCLQGVVIGIAGTAGGLVLGFTFLHFRNDLVHFVTRLTGSQAVLEQFYQFSDMPSHTSPHDLILIVVAAIVLSTLAGIIPAVMAVRLKPVEALRHE